jgi:hypothetical protein
MISSHTTPNGSSPEDYGERVYNTHDPDCKLPCCQKCDAFPCCDRKPHPQSKLGMCAQHELEAAIDEMKYVPQFDMEAQAEVAKWRIILNRDI